MVLDKNQINYITFILGADDFEICHKLRKLPSAIGIGIDELYDLTNTIATAFAIYDTTHNASADISEYQSLTDFLRDYETEITNFINGTINDLIGVVVLKECINND